MAEMSSIRIGTHTDLGLLILRIASGLTMFLAHGLPKLTSFSERHATFADPIGLGPSVSLGLTVFAEVFCAIALTLGIFSRFSAAVLAFTMAVAVFIVHGADPFARQELALMYGAIYLALAITGPGKFALK